MSDGALEEARPAAHLGAQRGALATSITAVVNRRRERRVSRRQTRARDRRLCGQWEGTRGPAPFAAMVTLPPGLRTAPGPRSFRGGRPTRCGSQRLSVGF